jgi:hypothetical protein
VTDFGNGSRRGPHCPNCGSRVAVPWWLLLPSKMPFTVPFSCPSCGLRLQVALATRRASVTGLVVGLLPAFVAIRLVPPGEAAVQLATICGAAAFAFLASWMAGRAFLRLEPAPSQAR